MSSSRRSWRREQITRAVLAELNQTDEGSYQYAMQHWWLNIRKNGGFRLTPDGDQALCATGIEKYTFEFDFRNQSFLDLGGIVRVLLDMDAHLDIPYYFYRSPQNKDSMMLRIYDKRTAVLINLYGGLAEWFKIVKDRKTE